MLKKITPAAVNVAPSFGQRFAARRVLWSVALVAVVYVATLIVMPRRGLWIVDNENRFLQAQALVDSGFSDYTIPWPGRSIDPSFATNPLRFNPDATFQELRNDQLISVFQPTFIVVSAAFFRILGTWGLYVLPLGAALLLLIGASRLAAALSLGRGAEHLAVLLTGLATPVWFYSQTFWEHTPAAALCIWGTVYAVRYLSGGGMPRLVTAFACLTAAVFFRDVLGIFAIVILVLLVLRRREGRLRTILVTAAVLIVGLGLLALFQWITTGRPFGFHAGTLLGEDAGLIGHLQDRPRLFYLFFCAAHPDRVLSLALAVPFVIAFLLRPRLDDSKLACTAPLWAAAASVTGGVFLTAFITAPNALRHLLTANSLFPAAPFLILAFLRRPVTASNDDTTRNTDFVLSAACLHLIIYCLVAPWAGAISLHWGARPLFTLYPLFAVLAAGTLTRWFGSGARRSWHAIIVSVLILVSVVGQVESVRLLARKKAFSVRLAQKIAGFTQPVVITNVWWLGHEMFPVFFDKSIFYIRHQTELEKLQNVLRARGIDAFVYVSRPRPGPPRPPIQRLDDGGWNFYSLDFVVAPVPPAGRTR